MVASGFLFREENINRLAFIGGDELSGIGEDGGVDLSGSSENMAWVSLGLEGGTGDTLPAGEELLAGIVIHIFSADSITASTRLRFVGGSSLCSECFFCRE